MSNIKHTPFPWVQTDSCLIYGPVSGDDDEAPFVADCAKDGASGEYSEEEQGNTALIAALPELLAALRGVMNPLNPIDDDGHDIALRLTREQWDAARAAIAKAENAA